MSAGRARPGLWLALILGAWPLVLGGVGLLGLSLRPQPALETVDPAPVVAAPAALAREDAGSLDEPAPNLIQNPAWAVVPTPRYPRAALAADVSEGRVDLQCEGLADGRLGACEIKSETPLGYGFGEAALIATRDARLKPRQVDGFATDSVIRFPVVFRVEGP